MNNSSKQLNLLKLAFKIYIAILVAFISYYVMQPSQHYNNIKQINRNTAGQLKQLVRTKFFKIIRINLENDCPFWAQKKICSSGSCNVCRCDQKDIPFTWDKTDKIISTTKGLDYWSNERQQNPSKWIWHVQDEQNDKGQYFDVDENKQAFTNYNGSFIWSLIYKQNCFSGNYDNMCKQQKILYKIISGLHTSIATHLSYFYKNMPKSLPLNLPKNFIKKEQEYYFNKELYNQRVLNYPQRIENLYFLYSILLKSVSKIKTKILEYPISSNNITQDLKSKAHLKNFIDNISIYSDSLKLDQFFLSQQSIMKQYQKYIHNISKIMDCVECQKCRLFGKMQTYGLGTSMKIIFGYENLKRNQLVALLNTLNKISMSVQIHLNNSKSEKEIVQFYLKLYLAVGMSLFVFLYIAYLAFQSLGGKVKKQFKHVFVKVE